jgi:hypothetical protein
VITNTKFAHNAKKNLNEHNIKSERNLIPT